ncbi:GSCOCT00014145001.2-RA-CDS [Cotesia congregata]|uniref:Cc_odve66_25 n=1 Tax=Cotesia congregata TaxID=51543 RepID=A0A8J2E865_COTCN|nr:GSCOCT00014145001.2-RA-CDS [Cotesia congregata]CAG5077189.1 Cc_odve66_25 [Cotesia congregata]
MIAMSIRAKKFALFGLVILVSAVACILTFTLLLATNHVENPKKVRAIKSSKLTQIKNDMKLLYDADLYEYNLNDSDVTMKDKVLNNNFENLSKEDKLREICVLGIKLLRNYLHDSSKTDYLKATSNIVDQILEKIKSIIAKTTFETDEEWELYIVDIPHLMAMYDLIVEDDSSNTNRLTQCYEYITKVINSNMESTYPKPTASKTDSKDSKSQFDFIKIGTPYLLTNYKRSLKDETYKNLFENAKKNKNLELVNKYLMTKEVSHKYGDFPDDGSQIKKQIADVFKCLDLLNIVKYNDLYIAVYNCLHVPGNINWRFQMMIARTLSMAESLKEY